MIDLEVLDNEQKILASQITLPKIDISKIETIAGIDTAYFEKDDKEYGVCCIDVFDINTFDVIEKVSAISEITFPYISGYLSYRELPVILNAYNKLKSKPDIFMLDGNGYMHPRHMGIATMFALNENVKSIGVAKTLFKFSSININLDKTLFSEVPIIINNELYGYAITTREGCNPIYVSPGNGISFENALDIVKKCIGKGSRIPIPTRVADIDTHSERKKVKSL